MRPTPAREHRLIQRVLTRRTAVIRRSPGDRRMPSQVLAANVDVVFVVTSVNAEFNVRRLERYVTVAWESGATPIVLLSKSDLADDLEGFRLQAETTAPGVEVIAVSGDHRRGHRGRPRLTSGPGRTVVFTGSSGVGKSSIVNALAGEPLLDTGGIRRTTRAVGTPRRAASSSGSPDGLLIDTPGLRELGVLDGDGLSTAFDDVERAGRGLPVQRLPASNRAGLRCPRGDRRAATLTATDSTRTRSSSGRLHAPRSPRTRSAVGQSAASGP